MLLIPGILASKFQAVQGDFESIATVVVGSGGQASAEFTSIPSIYQHLQIRGFVRTARADTIDVIQVQFNSDTGSNYSWHRLLGDGSSASSAAGTSVALMEQPYIPGNNATANVFAGVVIDVLDYKDTNKYTTIRGLGGYDTNGGGYIGLHSGSWRNTNAVSSIKLYALANLSQYSHFALYGIKG